jgi:PPOX class probable F420-dependent enzyme
VPLLFAPMLMVQPVSRSTLEAGPPAARPSAALRDRIRAERVAWLTMVRADGAPHVVPIWFSWDGETFLVFSKPHATKVACLRSNQAVMLGLGDPDDDFDVLLVEGRAEILGSPASDIAPASHFDRYRDRMAAIGLDRAEYLATYSLAIRITPTRFLGWAGRSHLAERIEAVLPSSPGPGAHPVSVAMRKSPLVAT